MAMEAQTVFKDSGQTANGIATRIKPDSHSILYKFVAAPDNIHFCPTTSQGVLVIKIDVGKSDLTNELEILRVLTPVQGLCIPYIYGQVEFRVNGDTFSNTIAMQFLQGMSLGEYVRNPKTDKSESGLDAICDGIAEAFEKIQDLHVIHRDGHMGNVFFVQPLTKEWTEAETVVEASGQGREKRPQDFRIFLIDFDGAFHSDNPNHEAYRRGTTEGSICSFTFRNNSKMKELSDYKPWRPPMIKRWLAQDGKWLESKYTIEMAAPLYF